MSNPSLFNPPVPVAPAITIFKDLFLNDLAKLPPKTVYRYPLPKVGLQSLCDRKDLVIRPADKGGGIVVLDKIDYENEMYRILNDQDTFKELSNNPTMSFKKISRNLLQRVMISIS